MSDSNRLELNERAALSEAEITAVRELAAASEAAGMGESRIFWDALAHADEQPNRFLLNSAGRLVGFLGIEGLGDDEAEATLLVAPDIDPDPLVTQLVEAALSACRASKTPALLVAIDRSAAGVTNALTARGAEVQFTEQKQRRDSTGPLAIPASDLSISAASPADAADIAAIQAADMGLDPVGFDAHVTANMDRPNYRYYIARQDGNAIGTANVQQLNGESYIYGFVVKPEARGHGYGRQLMLHMLNDLAAQGDAPMYLEVIPENTPAVTLYSSLGFVPVSTFDYYRLDA